MTPGLQLWRLKADRALEEEHAFVEDRGPPVEFEKSVGHSGRKARGMVIQVRNSGKFQGYRKFQGMDYNHLPAAW